MGPLGDRVHAVCVCGSSWKPTHAHPLEDSSHTWPHASSLIFQVFFPLFWFTSGVVTTPVCSCHLLHTTHLSTQPRTQFLQSDPPTTSASEMRSLFQLQTSSSFTAVRSGLCCPPFTVPFCYMERETIPKGGSHHPNLSAE